MKIAILSQDSSLYSSQRLKEACKKRGHEVRILNPLSFSIYIEQGIPKLHYKNKKVPDFDAVIPRIGVSINFFGMAVVRQFEQMGVFCLNSSLGINSSRDKLRSIQLLARHNIDIPKTAYVTKRELIMSSIEEIGGAPVVIKLLEGSQGVGVILAESNKVAEAIVQSFQSTRQHVLIQKFIEESKGRDIRAFVVGNKVVAAMQRQAQGDEFRSNVHRGADAKALKLDSHYERLAVRATQLMGLNVAGVDMLESKEGPKILEINSCPGLEGIETATAVDVASAVVGYIEEQAHFPEIDLRQRLTLDEGYGAAEIHILRNSNLVGKQIKEAGFREKDIVIMSISRKKQTISNPKSDCELLADDVLLCFGKLQSMKSLIEQKRKRKDRHFQEAVLS